MSAEALRSVQWAAGAGLTDMLVNQAIKWAKVGSRETCNPAPTDTDDDVLVLVANVFDATNALMDAGYELHESAADYKASDGYFTSWRRDEVNVLMTANAGFYAKFMAATAEAKRLNLLVKANRVALFQRVLYGKVPA